MCMTNEELKETIKSLKEFKLMQEELAAEITSLEDLLKQEVTERNTEQLIVGEYKVTYKPVTSSRFDSKGLKAVNEDLYNQFAKVSQYMRLVVR